MIDSGHDVHESEPDKSERGMVPARVEPESSGITGDFVRPDPPVGVGRHESKGNDHALPERLDPGKIHREI